MSSVLFYAVRKLSILFAALFVDIGNNYDVLDHVNTSFIYEEVIDGQDADGGDTPVVSDGCHTGFQ